MKLGIVLFGHGSRDPDWRRPIEAVRTRMVAVAPTIDVECAYLEMSSPSLHEAVLSLVESGANSIRVVPMFLGVGRHAREDLPSLMADLKVAFPSAIFSVDPAVGERDEMIALLATLALNGTSTKL